MPLFRVTEWSVGDIHIAAENYAHAEAYWMMIAGESGNRDSNGSVPIPEKIEKIASEVYVELEADETPRKGAAVAVSKESVVGSWDLATLAQDEAEIAKGKALKRVIDLQCELSIAHAEAKAAEIVYRQRREEVKIASGRPEKEP